MSGAFTDAGTFSDDITYTPGDITSTPGGSYRVVRTLHSPRGGLEAVATVTTFQESLFSATIHGSWRVTGGTGAWSAVSAQGTLDGASFNASETWIGTVGP